jgi:ABC-type amino acid transport substrate-binding protein
MKRILLLFVITIMLATASLVSADTSVPQKIRIAAFNFYPTLFQAKDGSVQGFYVDFLSEIAKHEGWTIEYVYGNWADGLSRICFSKN